MGLMDTDEVRVRRDTATRIGSCNVRDCETTSRWVYEIDLGGLAVRVCPMHAAEIRTHLPKGW